MNEIKGQLCLDEWLELIKEDRNLYGAYFSISQYIDLIEKENQQLKIQISAREEEYRGLYETNKVLSQELTKDKILKQDHLTTCCGIPIGDIPKLIDKNRKLEQENQQLKLINKEYERLNKENGRGFMITSVKQYNIDELLKREENWNELKEFLETNWKETQDIWFVKIINKMQELERCVRDVED